MQDVKQILPIFIQTDKAYERLKAEESPFNKGSTIDINGNPDTGAGTNNPTGEGQNEYVLTPTRSNKVITGVDLPDGVNKTSGAFESVATKEEYHFVYNYSGNHSIWVIDGDTGVCTKVIEDPLLAITDDQEAFVAHHRVTLRVVLDENKNIIEKHLLWTNGKQWQGWINVVAAIATNGFDAQNAYWKLMPPHFDRKELLEWPVRPPMIAPVAEAVENTEDDEGKINRIIDASWQFAIDFTNTDGRYTTVSPWSVPVIINTENYPSNPDAVPKNILITLPAGSPLTEKIRLYVKKCGGLWMLYDTLNKFTSSGVNSPSVIGNNYWMRKNPWSEFTYDPVFNTIQYTFDFGKVPLITPQEKFTRLQTAMPQVSNSLTDFQDSVVLGNNRYDYPNFDDDVISKLDANIQQKPPSTCPRPIRDVYVYAYIGQCRQDFSYTSQVGYFLGDDTQMRFGGMRMSDSGATVIVVPEESKYFSLDFADRDALVCYAKGTAYFAVGEWYQVNQDNSLVAIPNLLDFDDNDVLAYAQNVFLAGGYFICRFHLRIPAEKYILTLGRHNVGSTGDFRNTSTYIYGIANSRVKSQTQVGSNNLTSIKPQNSIVTFSKEMEIDCTAGNVDVWGNNADTFYVYCPYQSTEGQENFRFIEGYLQESPDSTKPVELFPYDMTGNNADDWGKFTDKNGFYWAYTKARDSNETDIRFITRLNCTYPFQFIVGTAQGGIGWKQNPVTTVSIYNSNSFGACNRVLVRGMITSLTGMPYANISVSIKDGSTALTNQDGTFELVVHDGRQNTSGNRNIYVNASSNYLISTASCGYIPLNPYSDSLAPCAQCTERIYPIRINLAINIEVLIQTSLKESDKYSVGVVGADLAGRLMWVNEIKEVSVPSFLERDNTNATYIRALLSAQLTLINYPDIKWLTFSVSKRRTIKKYTDWVGDRIRFIDNTGNVTADPSTAVFVSIVIDSLFNYNLARNFTTLASYQFVLGDRLRVLDDGNGNLYDVATFGDPIDVQVLGTNYNQAATNAGILPQTTDVVINAETNENNQSITLILKYDNRFDKLKNKEGFWIEIYAPQPEAEVFPYCEVPGFYPVINGIVSEFIGYGINGAPQYNQLLQKDLNYWDTYYLQRNISVPDAGNLFFNHPFQSENITDNWGKGCTSCGRQHTKNEEAAQSWLPGELNKSLAFAVGSLNGLATFTGEDEHRKDYGSYPYGGITAMVTQMNYIAIFCQNSWFLIDFKMRYSYVNDAGLLVTNLNDTFSEMHQRIGSHFGLSYEDTACIIFDDEYAYFLDTKNTALAKCNYQKAIDITQENEGERGGIQSWLNNKCYFIQNWNTSHELKDRFDKVMGIDVERGNIYLTFRPRRNNSNNLESYVSQRRNYDERHQETMVYSIKHKAWLPMANFTPEVYSRVRGAWANQEFITFAAGKPYYHNGTANNSFNEFYGIQTSQSIIGVFNSESSLNKILGNISQDTNPLSYYADLIYSDDPYSFSYLPLNLFKKKENQYYGAALRNMVSYPAPNPPNDSFFVSTLQDGKRIFGRYFVCRLISAHEKRNDYCELKNVFYLNGFSHVAKK